jgi:SEC-C motif-containing protein
VNALSSPSLLPCPCGSATAYADCCGRFHTGPQQLQAPDAERLMRSRYSGLKWLGLEVRCHRQHDDRRASVEFIARNKLGGRAQRLHETSRFVREDGRWYYLDGETG